MKCSIAACLALSLFSLHLHAEEVRIPAKAYAQDSPFHLRDMELALKLPEGWRYLEHGGHRYLIGGKDVYGFITLSYSELGLSSLRAQFGTATPPSIEVDGETVYRVVKPASASFARTLGEGWELKGSLTPYPGYSEAELGSYPEAFAKIMASATFNAPILDAEAPVLALEPGKLYLAERESEWSVQENALRHASGLRLEASLVTGNVAEAMMGVLKLHSGKVGQAWKPLGQAIIGWQDDSGMALLMKLDEVGDQQRYLFLRTEKSAEGLDRKQLLRVLAESLWQPASAEKTGQ